MEEEEKKVFLGKYKNVKSFVLDMTAYSSASIFGPLVFFGAIGYFLDKAFGSKPMMLIFGIAAAFVFTNFFLFSKAFKLAKIINRPSAQPEAAVRKEEGWLKEVLGSLKWKKGVNQNSLDRFKIFL